MSSDKVQTVKIIVNDKELEAVAGSMLIEIADEVGIHIPRFCYHKKLSVSANCRMCLVEVEKAPKPMPACATPVMEGMKVWTKSEKALSAQKDTMEFLLINHPLDCPICDQGGECELQDLSMAAGGSSSSFQEIKRVVADKDIGELVATEMTRCIQCTRCVRFGEEIAGMRELGATGRGDRMEIGTFVEKSLSSELSGNIIDICPVGALTAKPSRYKSRAWEMMQTAGIASHDCVGSNISLHTSKNQLVRVVASENENINECWISDRDRFSYQGVEAKDRAGKPMIKVNSVWKNVEWTEALEQVAERLKTFDANDVGVLVSPRATLEEQYLLQKSMRAIGVNNIDHRLRQVDFSQQEAANLFPWLGMSIAEIDDLDAVLLVGSNVRKEQPMINHRIRKAALKGAKIMCVNSRELEFNYDVETQVVTDPLAMVDTLAAIAKQSISLAKGKIADEIVDLLENIEPDAIAKTVAQNLKDADNAALFVGSLSVQHPAYSIIKALSAVIAEQTGAKLGYFSESGNSAGAWLAGVVPHRQEAGITADLMGKNVAEMLQSSMKAYVLLDVEPEFDCDNPADANDAMQKAECVIAITPYTSTNTLEYADIILPSAGFGETSGTYVNVEGSWQSFRAAAKSFADARPAWKILRVLGNALGVQGFDYVSSSDVRDELKIACDTTGSVSNVTDGSGTSYTKPNKPESTAGLLQRIGDVSMYSGDSLVRRAKALQDSLPDQNIVYVNSAELKKLGIELASIEDQEVSVKQGDNSITMEIALDDSIPDACALVYSGTQSSALLGSAFGTIELTV